MMEIVHRIERVIALTLIALMALVVASATVEVGYELVVALREPPGLFLGLSELFSIFGLFLLVLIGLELMASVQAYLEDHRIHAELMFLIALTALTRKIVIMDAATLEPMTLFAMALLVIALAAGYYLVARARVHYE